MSYSVLNLESGEHVILEVRKHWVVFAVHALSLVLFAFIPFILYGLLKYYLPDFLLFSVKGNVPALFLFFYSLWLLVLWIAFFIDWTKYYLDVWYVTEKRIIIVDQRHLFDRAISNIRFDKIQDVVVEVNGFIPTFLKFGNIKVQTASEDNTEFTLNTVRRPEEVRKIIFNQHNEISDRKS